MFRLVFFHHLPDWIFARLPDWFFRQIARLEVDGGSRQISQIGWIDRLARLDLLPAWPGWVNSQIGQIGFPARLEFSLGESCTHMFVWARCQIEHGARLPLTPNSYRSRVFARLTRLGFLPDCQIAPDWVGRQIARLASPDWCQIDFDYPELCMIPRTISKYLSYLGISQ